MFGRCSHPLRRGARRGRRSELPHASRFAATRRRFGRPRFWTNGWSAPAGRRLLSCSPCLFPFFGPLLCRSAGGAPRAILRIFPAGAPVTMKEATLFFARGRPLGGPLWGRPERAVLYAARRHSTAGRTGYGGLKKGPPNPRTRRNWGCGLAALRRSPARQAAHPACSDIILAPTVADASFFELQFIFYSMLAGC